MSTSVACKTVKIIFSIKNIIVPYDKDLIIFLESIPDNSAKFDDIYIFENYYGYEWPTTQSKQCAMFCGFEEL